MTRKSSEDVFQVMEKRSIMGVMIDFLEEHRNERTSSGYHQIKEQMKLFPEGVMKSEEFQKQLRLLLDKKELILVTFRKTKKNGKIGYKKKFNKGLCYYTGKDADQLTKIYVHWDEEKEFLLKNVQCLGEEKSYFVKKQFVDLSSGICCIIISLFSVSDEKLLLAEVCLYAGWETN